ncbi:MAG: 50S ribosomal protein L15 [Alphaproteobacteria bacterium]|nr:50S ribosomal protein L15 [Alphaproteobacteria bacterium]
MQLNQLRDKPGATEKRTRVGRGPGSGKGKTAGRGHKGQKSRTGVSIRGFEGGQMPIYRRLPKRGFNIVNPKEFAVINVGRLQKVIDEGRLDAGKPVDGAALEAAGMVRQRRDGVRLLASGELKAKLAITVDHASAAAIAAVEKVGGSVTVIAKASAADEAKPKKAPKKKTTKKSDESGEGNE